MISQRNHHPTGNGSSNSDVMRNLFKPNKLGLFGNQQPQPQQPQQPQPTSHKGIISPVSTPIQKKNTNEFKVPQSLSHSQSPSVQTQKNTTLLLKDWDDIPLKNLKNTLMEYNSQIQNYNLLLKDSELKLSTKENEWKDQVNLQKMKYSMELNDYLLCMKSLEERSNSILRRIDLIENNSLEEREKSMELVKELKNEKSKLEEELKDYKLELETVKKELQKQEKNSQQRIVEMENVVENQQHENSLIQKEYDDYKKLKEKELQELQERLELIEKEKDEVSVFKNLYLNVNERNKELEDDICQLGKLVEQLKQERKEEVDKLQKEMEELKNVNSSAVKGKIRRRFSGTLSTNDGGGSCDSTSISALKNSVSNQQNNEDSISEIFKIVSNDLHQQQQQEDSNQMKEENETNTRTYKRRYRKKL
ncbi:hypothetical protein MP638_000097 [Amoeboaphelidium occidentale]|nr:hypothetical protein MP638_000097 [Amoeboaphelidium occidentale]